MRKSSTELRHKETTSKRTPKKLGVENLEGRLNLSTLFGLVNNYSVEVPVTGTYEVTLRNTGTRSGLRQIKVDATSPNSPLWVQSESAFAGTAQGDRTVALSLTAGKHILSVNSAEGTVKDTAASGGIITSTQDYVQFTATTTSPTLSAYDQSGDVVMAGAPASSGATTTTKAPRGNTKLSTAPLAPTGLTAATMSSSQISLAWSDASNNETGFKIERTLAGTDQWVQIASVGTNVKTFTDNGLSASTGYQYRVCATNTAGDSGYSATVTQTTSAVVTIPAAPGSLTTTTLSTSEITVSWVDNAGNESGFEVDRSLAGANQWVRLTTTGSNVTRYADSGLMAGTAYDYRVRAVNVAGGSAYATATGTTNQAAPAMPGTLAATATSQTQINLTWADNSSNETGFKIERSVDGSTWAAVTTTSANVTSYADAGLTASTTYLYRISAVNGVGASGYTTAQATTQAAVTVTAPAAPSGLSATAISTSEVTLMWADNSTNETGFQIDRSTDGVNWTKVTTTGSNTNTYADGGLAAGTNYMYRVSAVNTAGASGYVFAAATTQASVIPQTPPTDPVASGVVLTPGTGFTGVTAQPGQVGTGAAATQSAIARWDVVPYQTFDKTMNIGVVAFHSNGIDRVEFSVNGGAWTAVSQPSLNPETGVVEYWATLDATKFAKDGALEVRAIVYPKAGVPRVLQGSAGDMLESGATAGETSVILNSNANHTLTQAVRYVSAGGNDSTGNGTVQSPFATIKAAMISIQTANGSADGGTVYLMPGSYMIDTPQWWEASPVTTTRWVKITAAPGVTQAQVNITGTSTTSGANTKLLEISNVTLTGAVEGSAAFLNQGKVSAIWYDNVSATGTDRLTSVSPFGIKGAGGSNLRYATNVSINTMDDGFNDWALVRNANVQHTAAGAFRNVGIVLNSTVVDIDNLGNAVIHPDVLQISSSISNMIVDNVVATDRINAFIRLTTFAGQTAKDVAIVNSKFTATSPYVWELASTNVNYLIKNTSFGGPFSEYAGLVMQDVVFDTCTFTSQPAIVPGMVIR